MKAALDAVTYGASVRILLIDGNEPATPTVQSDRYPLKRPVIVVAKQRMSALARAFVDFTLSPAGQTILERQYVPLAR